MYVRIIHRRRNGLAHGGPKGHGAELTINIAIASMHAILYIDIFGPTFVMSGGGAWPPCPPSCSTAYVMASTVALNKKISVANFICTYIVKWLLSLVCIHRKLKSRVMAANVIGVILLPVTV